MTPCYYDVTKYVYHNIGVNIDNISVINFVELANYN